MRRPGPSYVMQSQIPTAPPPPCSIALLTEKTTYMEKYFPKGKSKEIPIEVRSQIIALNKHTSKSHRQIATVIGVSHSFVTKIIRLYKETREFTSRSRSGRPKVTSSRTDLRIRRELLKSPFISASEIKERLTSTCDQVSKRTTQSRLRNKY
ncbi:uncharacterized protein LOC136079120 [Hydra vulgaris]|uniref:Uncharacterized protein LOC136079120 n=1 Tax=Hydra vulgaris TaxID=6087 RepID=A0ABM4BP70_HYDVU